MSTQKPTPETNPWVDAFQDTPEAGVDLDVCPHCNTRTWIHYAYFDPDIPKEECAHCGCVWEGDHIIEPSDAGVTR